jgi:hypothetical protein
MKEEIMANPGRWRFLGHEFRLQRMIGNDARLFSLAQEQYPAGYIAAANWDQFG